MTDLSKTGTRKPFTAVALSLIMPGLGQMYCGRFAKGLVLSFLSWIFIPAFFVSLLINNSPARLIIMITVIFASLVVWLVAIIDSWYTARHTADSYLLKDYNKWYIYLLLILMGAGGVPAIASYVRADYVETFIISNASNYPTLVPNDRFLTNKRAYSKSDPQRGDLIVFLNPENRHIRNIKRVVALAGDTVEVRDGQLYINDQKLQRRKLDQSELNGIRINVEGKPLEGEVFEEINGTAKYNILPTKLPQDNPAGDFAKITVPAYHCFVLGDNRNLSLKLGPIPLTTIIGRADYLHWPAKDWSRFGSLKK
jgi:signal peptidase I